MLQPVGLMALAVESMPADELRSSSSLWSHSAFASASRIISTQVPIHRMLDRSPQEAYLGTSVRGIDLGGRSYGRQASLPRP